jgi:hypothetical protein
LWHLKGVTDFWVRWFDLNHSGRPGPPSFFADCWKQFLEFEKLNCNHSKQLNNYENPDHSEKLSDSTQDKDYQLSSRLVIQGIPRMFIPCSASTIAEIRRAITEDGCVSTIEETSLAMVTWAMTASEDQEYLISAHLKNDIAAETLPAATAMDSKISNSINDPPNPQAAEEDWEKYASVFQATDLDRLMIEETAKAEGSMRLVFDEVSGQVVGLGVFARRTADRAKETHSAEVSHGNWKFSETLNPLKTAWEDRPEDLKEYDDELEDTATQNRSQDLNDRDRVGKRKVEDEVETGPAEKRAKL